MTHKRSVAILGTRGIPAHYGGFETFAQELSSRLAERGWRVVVYGRRGSVGAGTLAPGVESVLLNAVRTKHLETLSHTALSISHLRRNPTDVALCCNLANVSLLPLLKNARIPTALLVDGFEAERAKWGLAGRTWLKAAERIARHAPDMIVADAAVIERYWSARSRSPVTRIAYGVDLETESGRETLDELGLEPDGYFLYVSRLEPENNAHRVIRAYRQVVTDKPLVIVGDAPYAKRYIRELHRLADSRVRFVGARYDRAYRQLQFNCLAYIQATEVGGTHPALLEGLAWSPLVLVHDTPENREVAGDGCWYFPYRDEAALTQLMRRVLDEPESRARTHGLALGRLLAAYNWTNVTDAYETLLSRLVVMKMNA
jgi:glycosyltransferase involved in cell wall biosynthesis